MLTRHHVSVRSLLITGLLTGAGFLSVSAVATPANAEIIDGIAAIVGESVITMSDVLAIAPVYFQVIGVDPSRLQTAEGRATLGREILDHVIITKLVVAVAEEYGMAITDSELESYLEDRREQMHATEEQFEEALAAEGIALEDFREFMRDNLTLMRMIQVEVASNISITEDQIDREVERRYPDGLVDTYITTSHLLVQVGPEGEEAARARIDALAQELADGTPFEALALQNPDGTSARRGRVGRFRLGQLDENYQRAAMALEVGEISEPVRSQFGWHIIRLDDLEREPVNDASRIRDEIAYDLQTIAVDAAQEAYFADLRETAFVEIISSDLPW